MPRMVDENGEAVHKNYRRYNYISIKHLLNDFAKYKGVEFIGVDEGRHEAITALVSILPHYHRNKGYVISKQFTVIADYTPRMRPKRYNYDMAYSMVFKLLINEQPFADVEDVFLSDDTLTIRTKDVTFLFNTKKEYVENVEGTPDTEEKENDDNGKPSQRDMAHDEEEMPQPEEQGLQEIRGPRSPRVSRVARI